MRQDEGDHFCAGAEVLLGLTGQRGLETSYLRLVDAFAELKRVSAELLRAQKLAALGTLASGIAHELGTPIQFLSDSLQYLSEGFKEMGVMLTRYRPSTPGPGGPAAEPLAEDTASLAYLEENVPASFALAREGVSRIIAIVRAMREYAHPGGAQKRPEDLNRALRSALAIAKGEYKHVAEIDLELGELPPVVCHLGEVNQVFLNLLVNAAHAVADVADGRGTLGRIGVRTTCEGAEARIEISDTGCGIEEAIRHRVFDPFFTTKEVGRGSGQGLAIAQSIVVDRHGGSLTFESEVGKGTTFVIRLPVDGGVPR